MTRSRFVPLVALVAGLVAGCGGGPRYVKVTGLIRLNGVPYDRAVVSFQPMGSRENLNPGRGSSSYTDANGRFDLVCDMEKEGAVVGKHRVRIMTRGNDVVGFDPTTGSPDGPYRPVRAGTFDPIPPEWNALSTVEFVVPPGGTDQANFDIDSKLVRRK